MISLLFCCFGLSFSSLIVLFASEVKLVNRSKCVMITAPTGQKSQWQSNDIFENNPEILCNIAT